MKYVLHIKILNIFLLLLNNLSIIISGCAYDVYTIAHDIRKTNFPIINLYSYDPYELMTIMTKEKFRMNNIPYFDCTIYKSKKCAKSSCISLHIISISEKYIRTALFQDGQSAEYQLILTVFVKIQTNLDTYHQFYITTSKSFFNNPESILANFVKKNTIRQKIYEEASEELIRKLLFFIQKIYKY